MEKIIALLLLAVPLWAAPNEAPLREANALYKEGQFAQAAEKYQAQADAGVSHWVLEYNLGNAYYRAGQLGRALLHYERAFRLKSNQKDVVYNLALASAKAGDPRMPDSGLLVLGWTLYYGLTLNALTVVVSFVFAVLVLFAGLSFQERIKIPGRILGTVVIVELLLGGWLGSRIYQAEHPHGVVIATLAEVRSGPSTTYPANFTVPEGHRVLILDTQESIQGWLQIGVPREGLRGWVPDTAVSVI